MEDYWQGRWDAALDDAELFLADAETGSPHLMEVVCWLVRGWIRLARGDPSGALEDTGTGLRLGRMAHERQFLYPALASHARALVSAGRTDEAQARAGELFTMVAEEGAIATDPDWSRDLAVVFQALGRGAELVERSPAKAFRHPGSRQQPPSPPATTTARRPLRPDRLGRTRRTPA